MEIDKDVPQDSIVDLTSINDEDVIVIGSPEARKPAVKRKSSQSSLLLPDSPVGGPSAKCGICFQNMDEKMSCGPCGCALMLYAFLAYSPGSWKECKK